MSTKFSVLNISDSEETEIVVLDPGDVCSIYVDKPETEDWYQMDV